MPLPLAVGEGRKEALRELQDSRPNSVERSRERQPGPGGRRLGLQTRWAEVRCYVPRTSFRPRNPSDVSGIQRPRYQLGTR